MADTTSTKTDQTSVLIVAPSPDDLLLRLGQSLQETGAAVHFTTDVYMAMARLATGERFGHVVVEAAALDDYERSFLSLAPQYYESASFYVPARSVLDERMLTQGRYDVLSPDGIVDAVLGIRDAETLEAAEATWSEPRTIGEPDEDVQPSNVESDTAGACFAPANEAPQPPRLSTDGDMDASQSGPSLHDAVRERMGANGGGVQRRRPPGAPPAPSDTTPPESETRVSREEMDALLGADDETLDDMTDATREDGKGEA
ncbi:MAG TPA: hypothetical protein P5081_24300 [Phycisphaerae bacterium]|nr:hypothetical protein [Phycisphaerae bacterium]HRW56009.1 hypothetical protein [Phycisphaerae bacterium]